MSLDKPGRSADGEAVAVVDALLVELGDRPRRAVADALGLAAAQATRILDGTRKLYPHELALIERAWGLPLGTILRRAGLVDDIADTRTVIASDPHLLPHQREVLTLSYDSLTAAQGPAAKSRTSRRTSRS